MNSTTTLLGGPDFPKQLVGMLMNAVDEGTKQAYRMIWAAIEQFLFEHWILVTIVLFLVLLFAFLKYLATGRWAMLGSVLYSYVYWGIVFVITLIFGSDIFANDWFKVVLFIVYVVSFTLVGHFLRKTGIRR
jgi:hypothetical protein